MLGGGLVEVAVAGVAGLTLAVILALILLLIYALVKVSSMLRFDTQEYIVEGGVEEVRRKLSEALRFRGLTPLTSDDSIVIDDVFKLTIRLRQDDGARTKIMYYAEAKTWLVLLVLILLLLNVAIGAAGGFLAYLRYDDLRRSVRAALGEIGARRIS